MPEIIVKLGDQVVQKYYFYKDSIGIGRAPSNEISIENLAVSRRHATVTRNNESYIIEDLGSSNGTYVNDVKVAKTEILDKDVVAIGKHKLYFYNDEVSKVGNEEKTMMVSSKPAQASGTLRIRMGRDAERAFKLDHAETSIGRSADCHIRVQDWFLSGEQAQIVRKGLIFIVRNVGNWRRTQVNGVSIDEQALKPGDVIQVGRKLKMVFEVPAGVAEDAPLARKPVELSDGSADAPLPIAGQTSMSSGGSPFDTIGVPGMNGDSAHDPAKSSPTADIQEVWNDIPAPKPDSPAESPPSEPQPEAVVEVVNADNDNPQDDANEFDSDISDHIEAPSVRLDLDALVEESVATPDEPEVGLGAPTAEDDNIADEVSDSALANEPLIEMEPAAASELYEPDLSAHSAAEKLLTEGQDEREKALVASIMEAVGEAQGLDLSDVKVWVHALFNSSEVIRKQAQRKLKQLTGETYDAHQQ